MWLFDLTNTRHHETAGEVSVVFRRNCWEKKHFFRWKNSENWFWSSLTDLKHKREFAFDGRCRSCSHTPSPLSHQVCRKYHRSSKWWNVSQIQLPLPASHPHEEWATICSLQSIDILVACQYSIRTNVKIRLFFLLTVAGRIGRRMQNEVYASSALIAYSLHQRVKLYSGTINIQVERFISFSFSTLSIFDKGEEEIEEICWSEKQRTHGWHNDSLTHRKNHRIWYSQRRK